MGREIKRVPLDFNWPIGKIWYGYAISRCLDGDEHYKFTCEDCRLYAQLKMMEFTSYNCPIFESLDPPEGEGWQMWEDVTEGSPMSPVFATPEGLAQWLADNGASSFGSDTATYEQWLAMIKQGWAVSMVADNKGLKSGVEASLDK